VPTVLGFLLWYAGAARISGAEAGLTTALVPVSAVAFAALVLREPVRVAQLVGVACVLGAVLLATFGRRRMPRGTA
jgi:drug/metabolite transporter (DMT)-like permease